jgi:hypothetical protein
VLGFYEYQGNVKVKSEINNLLADINLIFRPMPRQITEINLSGQNFV